MRLREARSRQRSAVLEARPRELPQRAHLLRPGAAEAGARHVPLRLEPAGLPAARSRREHLRRNEPVLRRRQGEQDLRADGASRARSDSLRPATCSRLHRRPPQTARARASAADVVRRTESLLLERYAPAGRHRQRADGDPPLPRAHRALPRAGARTAAARPAQDGAQGARWRSSASPSRRPRRRRPRCAGRACASNRTVRRASATWSWSPWRAPPESRDQVFAVLFEEPNVAETQARHGPRSALPGASDGGRPQSASRQARRRARGHQGVPPVDHRGAPAHQRRADVGQRGARLEQRGAAEPERGAARPPRRSCSRPTRSSPRSTRSCRRATPSSTSVNSDLVNLLGSVEVPIVIVDGSAPHPPLHAEGATDPEPPAHPTSGARSTTSSRTSRSRTSTRRSPTSSTRSPCTRRRSEVGTGAGTACRFDPTRPSTSGSTARSCRSSTSTCSSARSAPPSGLATTRGRRSKPCRRRSWCSTRSSRCRVRQRGVPRDATACSRRRSEGRSLYEIMDGVWDIPELRSALAARARDGRALPEARGRARASATRESARSRCRLARSARPRRRADAPAGRRGRHRSPARRGGASAPARRGGGREGERRGRRIERRTSFWRRSRTSSARRSRPC